MKTKTMQQGATTALITYTELTMQAEAHYYYGMPQIEMNSQDVQHELIVRIEKWAEKTGMTLRRY